MPNVEILSNAISEEPGLIAGENEVEANVTIEYNDAIKEQTEQKISLKEFVSKFSLNGSGHKLYKWRFQIAYLEARNFNISQITNYLNSNGVEIDYQKVRGYLKTRSAIRLFVHYELVGENKPLICTTGYLDEAISKIIERVGSGETCIVKFEQRYLTNCEWDDLTSQ